MAYRLLADAVVLFHFAYVGFVILGFVAILLGKVLRWSWVRNFWFRMAHLLTIGVVALESLGGITCPLTRLEDYLRLQAGETVEQGSFIGRCMHSLVFYAFPEWVFTIVYCLFCGVVAATLVWVPPRWPACCRGELPRTAREPEGNDRG
jgi:hypothetical protein